LVFSVLQLYPFAAPLKVPFSGDSDRDRFIRSLLYDYQPLKP